MNTTLLLVMVLGAGVTACLVLAVVRLLPADVEASDALDRITRAPRAAAAAGPAVITGKDRLGQWAMRVLPPAVWVRTPTQELTLLRTPLTRFYADKVEFACLGLIIPPFLGVVFTLLGLHLPFVIPTAAGLGLAAVMFFIPNYNAISEAKQARAEFRRALTAYIDLVATERHNGSASRQAMESAAEIGNSWVFTRLAEELRRSHWSGVPPWDALRSLADELGLPELADFTSIMRLSGHEGTAVYTTLRARSTSLRTAMLNDELAAANAIGERMSIPGSLLGVVFMALLLAPAILGMLLDT